MSYILTTDYLDKSVAAALRQDAAVVLRTDTIYGVVAMASSQVAVEHLYQLKNRDSAKAMIILVASLNNIPELSPTLSAHYQELTADKPTSLLVPVQDQPDWLTRSLNELAFRVPKLPELQALIREVGPLVAPSANPEGQPVASTVKQAVSYFGDDVAVYVDGGEVPIDASPSRLIRLNGSQLEIVRR